ncbi:response regulator [Candidatus Uhrbacteria bacterium]|nr:response regulator [Candidatus Uhrbacteria bacterium]
MPANKNKMILIVEDDEIMLRAMYLSFHRENISISTATDGEQALKMTERLKPDLVLLDLIMPKMDGFEYLKNMKANSAISKIPVVVLSNLGDNDSIEKAKELGAEDYFVKSDTNLSDLVAKTRKLLNN